MVILIPDTASLINMHEVYVGQNHIIDVLNQLFNVQVSREIPHEIRRNKSKLGNKELDSMLKDLLSGKKEMSHDVLN